MNADDLREAGEALLATVRGVMSGREIAACEWASDPDAEEDICLAGMPSWEMSPAQALQADEVRENVEFQTRLLATLCNQFPREIRDHIDGKGGAK